jgi:hypothetical protein
MYCYYLEIFSSFFQLKEKRLFANNYGGHEQKPIHDNG